MNKNRNVDGYCQMRRIVGLGIVLGLVAVGIWRYRQPVPSLTAVNQAINLPAGTTAQVNWPSSAESAVGALGYGVLATSNVQTPVPIASVAKLITSLAVLQKYPLKLGEQGPTITLTAGDVGLYNKYNAENGSTVPVQAGEQISEYQILQAMLLPSANNLADSAAIWAYGSMAAYKAKATQLVLTLGLTQTTIGSDASGFAPDTTSTASDLVKLGEAAMGNSVLEQIVGQTTADLPVVGQVYNVDSLLGHDGIIGAKTGNSDQAGGVFVFAANHVVANKTVVMIGAVAGVPDLQAAFNATLPLLESAKSNLVATTVTHTGDVLVNYTLPWGGKVSAVSQHDLIAATWKGSTIQPALEVQRVKVPSTGHAVVGSLSLTVGGQIVATPVVLQRSIGIPPWWWRIIRHKL